MAVRRLQVLARTVGASPTGSAGLRLLSAKAGNGCYFWAMLSDRCAERVVTIGEVTVPLVAPLRGELVPFGYATDKFLAQQTVLQHLRWMMQKVASHCDSPL